MYYFFLTIDKVKLTGKPTPQDLLEVRDTILDRVDLNVLSPYQLFAFELKKKGTKHGNYLHYHTMLKSSLNYVAFTDIQCKGWSINLQKLRTCDDVARVAAYITKLKLDPALQGIAG